MKYHVYGVVSGIKYLGVVEADSSDEAYEKGFNLNNASVSLCNYCSRECSDPEIRELIIEEDEEV